MQIIGGASETTIGAFGFVGTSPTVFGSVVSAGAVAHGIDTVQAGIRGSSTYTFQGMMALGANLAFAGVADATLGTGLTFGSAMLRMSALPPTTTWTRDFAVGSGETDKYGNMTLSSLGTDMDRAQVAIHEGVHSVLSPSEGGMVNAMRAKARISLYKNSQFFRYTEEVLAESTAQLRTREMSGFSFNEAMMTGLRFPLRNDYYRINLTRVGLEAAGGATVVGGGAYLLNSSTSSGSTITPLGKKP
jgi:hypothetical protein